MSKKKRINLKKFIPFCIICILIIAGIVFGIAKLINKEPEVKECVHEYAEGVCIKCGEKDPDYVKPDEIVDLSMVCGGDVMYHISQLKSAYNYDGQYSSQNNDFTAQSGTFSFDDAYQYIKGYVEAADIAFINLETTFAGGPYYSGSWARFNTPDGLAKTLKDTGFDVVFTSNNHSLDRDLEGLQRTVEVLRGEGLETVGSRTSTSDDRSLVTEVKGVKIGVVSYTYETAEVNGNRTLNGSAMEEGAWNYLNTFRYGSDRLVTDSDKAAIKEQIDWCKDNGAEIIVCYFHWDAFNEYVLEVDNLQKDLAKFAAESGADIIFGSHPHRVQEIDEITISVDGKEKTVPVYYSLGNFISNQRYESLITYGDPEDQARATEQELLAYLELSYNKTKGELSIAKVKAVPLWVDRYSDGGSYSYRIIPLVSGFEENEDLVKSGHGERAKQALINLTELLGEEYIYN